jgi:prepilin-type N-terminal cleavage/methylation domain-containing protein
VKHRPKINGFTLVETLVATAIVAAALGVTWQVVETGARQNRAVESRRIAILVAQSQMAAVGAAQNNSLGDTRGVTDGISWRIAIKPYTAGPASAIKLEEVSVTTGLAKGLESDKRDLFTLQTIRVAR